MIFGIFQKYNAAYLVCLGDNHNLYYDINSCQSIVAVYSYLINRYYSYLITDI